MKKKDKKKARKTFCKVKKKIIRKVGKMSKSKRFSFRNVNDIEQKQTTNCQENKIVINKSERCRCTYELNQKSSFSVF